MKVYKVKNKALCGSSIVFKESSHVIDDITIHLDEGVSGDVIEIEIGEISEEEYDNLPEFEGY